MTGKGPRVPTSCPSPNRDVDPHAHFAPCPRVGQCENAIHAANSPRTHHAGASAAAPSASAATRSSTRRIAPSTGIEMPALPRHITSPPGWARCWSLGAQRLLKRHHVDHAGVNIVGIARIVELEDDDPALRTAAQRCGDKAVSRCPSETRPLIHLVCIDSRPRRSRGSASVVRSNCSPGDPS